MDLHIPLGSQLQGITAQALLGGHRFSQVFLGQGDDGRLYTLKIARCDDFTEGSIENYLREWELYPTSNLSQTKRERLGELLVTVAPYISGDSLEHCLSRTPRIHGVLARELLRQVAKVLGSLHRAGQVHGGLKPGNLVLTQKDKHLDVWVLDCGVHHLIPRADEEHTVQLGGSQMEYSSIRQFRGEPPTSSCDLFALGVILYQMLTGIVPYPGGVKFRPTQPQPLLELVPDVDKELAGIVQWLLAIEESGEVLDASALVKRLDPGESTARLGRSDKPITVARRPLPSATEERTTALPPITQEPQSIAARRDETVHGPALTPSELSRWDLPVTPPARPLADKPKRQWTPEMKLMATTISAATIIIISLVIIALMG